MAVREACNSDSVLCVTRSNQQHAQYVMQYAMSEGSDRDAMHILHMTRGLVYSNELNTSSSAD